MVRPTDVPLAIHADLGVSPDPPGAAFPRQPNHGTSVDTLAGAERAVRALTA